MTTPTSFGKYQVANLLGSGGMAEVYAGIHPDLGRKVAIKVILPQFATEPNFEERFRREARVVASLRHAHIVQLFDFDVVDGRHFMVMEYLDGGTLKEHLRTLRQQQARMALPEIAALLDAMAGALDYAHRRGAVHRDIKPANILFTAERDPVLTDFGIAKLLEGAAAQLTATGGVVGSPFYMPPEQATGGDVDARSDQYALGVVLYEMATGRVPFQGSTAVAVMTQHLNNTPPSPRALNPALPAALEAVVLKALAKQPDDRFGSCGELAQAFREALAGRSRLAAPTPGDAAATDAAATVVADAAERPAADATVPPANAATVVDAHAEAGNPHEGKPQTDRAQAEQEADPTQRKRTDAAPASPVESPPDKQPPDNADKQPPAPQDRPASSTPPKPPAQTFNVGGIQAGIVNQGGEQSFSGDMTFNLDFGEQKAAPPASAPPSAQAGPRHDAPELDALLDALRRAFAESGRVDRFVRLVTQFHAQLEALPAERAGERQQVVKRVRALLLEMTEADPDPDMVEIMGASLEKAVQPLLGADPDLSALATRITSWGELLVQPE